MFNLFNKSKVRTGKQTVSAGQKPAVGQPSGAKKQAPFAALGKTWAKLNKMDRKQAYTWGSIAVVALLALITFVSAMGGNEEDFSGFETRGYDLANMPFSSDEAEQYLLATKYPDMQNSTLPPGLYSSAEKEARQEEDAQAAEQEQQSWEAEEDSSSDYVPGRYYGGGGGGGRQRAPTQVGALNSASLKSAGGSGISGTFGPTGDFSNFRSQEKGSDVFVPQQGSAGNARKALFTSAMGSRAAAGQLDNRLANAKKAMLGNVQGSAAFMNDSGAVDLSKAAGLNLDPNAPVSSADPNAFNDALDAAHDDAGNDAADQDQAEWWQTMLQDLAKQLVQGVLSMGLNATQGAIDQAVAARNAGAAAYQEYIANSPNYPPTTVKGVVPTDQLGDLKPSVLDQMGLEYNADKTQLMKGDTVVARASVKDGVTSWDYEDGQTIKIGRWDVKQIAKKDEKWYAENYPREYTQAKAYAKQAGYNARNKVPPSRKDFSGGQSNNLPNPAYVAVGTTQTVNGQTWRLQEQNGTKEWVLAN